MILGQVVSTPRMEAAFVMQEAFQPSACPTHLQRRFMVVYLYFKPKFKSFSLFIFKFNFLNNFQV